jgi:hypothetical protein
MSSQPKPLGTPKVEPDRAAVSPSPSKELEKSANDLLQKMEAVVADIKSYDVDEAPATAFSRERIKTVIQATSMFVRIPVASVVPLDGGVQITWRLADRHLRLFGAADESRRSYIYKSSGVGAKRVSEIIDVGAVSLAKCLHWLQQAS